MSEAHVVAIDGEFVELFIVFHVLTIMTMGYHYEIMIN
jgi:hypothetical protein